MKNASRRLRQTSSTTCIRHTHRGYDPTARPERPSAGLPPNARSVALSGAARWTSCVAVALGRHTARRLPPRSVPPRKTWTCVQVLCTVAPNQRTKERAMARASEARDWAHEHLKGEGDSLYTPFSGKDGDEID